jgi:sugar phosphate isomerase/epimerase
VPLVDAVMPPSYNPDLTITDRFQHFMPYTLSTYLFLRRRLHAGLLDALAISGADSIEVFAARQHFDYTSRAEMRELGAWFRSNRLRPLALHAPLFPDTEMGRGSAPAVNVVHVEKSRRIDAMDEVKRALECAEQIPFAYLILHLGEASSGWDARSLEHALTAVEHLRAFAAPLGVKLLLENLNNDLAQPEHLAEVIAAGHFRDVGVCLDLGHAHLSASLPGGGLATAIATLAAHVRMVHLHDNVGDRDAHLWPGQGSILWPETLRALASLPHKPAQVLEVDPSHDDGTSQAESALVQKLQETFAWLDACASEAAER